MANSVTAVFWTIFEVFRRPNLLSRVRSIPNAAVEASREESESKILGDGPLLQSIFAEVTRLRVVGIIPRYTVGGATSSSESGLSPKVHSLDFHFGQEHSMKTFGMRFQTMIPIRSTRFGPTGSSYIRTTLVVDHYAKTNDRHLQS